MRFDKLNIGCGARIEPGWINIDTEFSKNAVNSLAVELGDTEILKHDVRKGLPFPEGSIAMIHSEHFIEHLTRDEGQAFLRECHRVLVPGGVLRVSTPDLRTLALLYVGGCDVRKYDDRWRTAFSTVGYNPMTPCRMVNEGMREWGHLFIYDYDEMYLALLNAGFISNNAGRLGRIRVEHGKTTTPGMLVEGRPYTGDLVIEVRK